MLRCFFVATGKLIGVDEKTDWDANRAILEEKTVVGTERFAFQSWTTNRNILPELQGCVENKFIRIYSESSENC